MKRLRFIGVTALLFLAGCAAPPPTEQKDVAVVVPAPPAEERVTPPSFFEDRDLFADGIAQLNRPGNPDPQKARAIFASLLTRHPKSRWRPAAEILIRLIDEQDTAREAAGQELLLRDKFQTERSRALQENEQLKKTIRQLTEKFQAEVTTLTQENEKLRNDLQRLKNLDIELEKRERKLR